MKHYTSPLVSTHPSFPPFYSYNNTMNSLQNLDLGSNVRGNRESFSRNNDHGGFQASSYSCFSPRPQPVDHTSWACESDGEPLYPPAPSVPSWMYNEANQVPGMSMPGYTAPAYNPSSYMGGSTMNQNGYFVQGLSRPRNNDQNGHRNQGFTETRGNGQNGYSNQEFTERSNGVSVRNEGLMVLQNAVVVEMVQCIRILNGILCRTLPQLDAKAVPRIDQQSSSRIGGSVLGSPGPTISNRIFVGGLASTVTESDFKTYFNQFGTITNVEIKYDHFTQRPSGFGFITFDSDKAVDKVLLRTSFHDLKGKMVEVKRAFSKDIYHKTIRGQLGRVNYGLSKVSNLLSAFIQGSPSQVGGSGPNINGRFSPAAVSRSGYPSFSQV